MPALSDLTGLDVGLRQALRDPGAGFGGGLRDAAGRPGTAGATLARRASFHGLARKLDDGFIVNGLSRTGARDEFAISDSEAGTEDAGLPEPCRRARTEEERIAKLRANAHAAYESVVGSHTAALDTALDVLEAELRALKDRCDAHAEMLKSIRLYSKDETSRELAARGLEDCDGVLACRREIEAGCSRETFNR